MSCRRPWSRAAVRRGSVELGAGGRAGRAASGTALSLSGGSRPRPPHGTARARAACSFGPRRVLRSWSQPANAVLGSHKEVSGLNCFKDVVTRVFWKDPDFQLLGPHGSRCPSPQTDRRTGGSGRRRPARQSGTTHCLRTTAEEAGIIQSEVRTSFWE